MPEESSLSGSSFVYVSYIRVTHEKLWEALTTPRIIAQYRFGMNVESDWNVGSAWKMYADGHLMDAGEILESVAPRSEERRVGKEGRCRWARYYCREQKRIENAAAWRQWVQYE